MANFDHSLLLSAVPIVSVNGSLYREFILNINQNNNLPLLSLDEVQVSLSSSPTLGDSSSTYYSSDGTYNHNATLVYDMNNPGGGSNWVKLNGALSQGSGKADMFLDIPLGDFTGTPASTSTSIPTSAPRFLTVRATSTTAARPTTAKSTGLHPASARTCPRPTPRFTSAPAPPRSLAQCRPSPPCTTAQRTGSNHTPTGTVTFLFYTTIDGTGTPIGAGTVTLDANGWRTRPTPKPAEPRSYSFTAHYNGDTTYLPSDSPVEPLRSARRRRALIPPSSTRTGLRSLSPRPWAHLEDTASFDSLVSGFTPTGTVTYTFTGSGLASLTPPGGTWTVSNSTTWTETVTVTNGSIPNSYATGPLGAGTYSFSAVYTPAATETSYLTATSAAEPLTISEATPSVDTAILTANGSPLTQPAALGTSVEDTASFDSLVSGFTPTGTVTYTFTGSGLASLTPPGGTWTVSNSTTWTETVTVTNGSIPNSYATGPLGAGTYSFSAVYTPAATETNYLTATSAAEPLTISEATPSVDTAILTANGSPLTQPAALGTSVEDTASFDSLVSGFTPTGTVTYTFTGSGLASLTPPGGTWTVSNSTTWTETVTVTNGSVPNSYATGPLGAGTYSFSAVYTPAATETSYLTATRAAEPLTISEATPSVNTTIVNADGSTLTQPAALGTSVEDTASFDSLVSGFTPTGTVTYTFTGSELQYLTAPSSWTVTGSGAGTTWSETVTVTSGTIPLATRPGLWRRARIVSRQPTPPPPGKPTT